MRFCLLVPLANFSYFVSVGEGYAGPSGRAV